MIKQEGSGNNVERRNRSKKRKISKLKVFIFLLFIGVLIFLISKTGIYLYEKVLKKNNNLQSGITNPQYNEESKKGYIGTYKRKSDKEYKNYVQGALASWAQNSYWDKDMESSGCGITCIATVLSGYGKTTTPEDLRSKYYPSLVGDRMVDALQKDFKISCSNFYYTPALTQDKIVSHLKKDKPIIICVTNQPDDKWTTASHYMVLLGVEDNKVYISNPSAGDNLHKDSGWYEISEIMPYIVKGIFITQ